MYKINFLSSFLLWRRHFSNSIFIWCCLMQKVFPESEFIEFKPRLKSAKYLFLLSASLNFITLNTILSGTNHIKPSLKLGRGSNSLKSASALIYFKIKSAGRLQIADCRLQNICNALIYFSELFQVSMNAVKLYFYK